MAEIDYSVYDRTLNAVDRILEQNSMRKNKPRNYLGMSQIGEECERNLFYSFRNASRRILKAKSIKAIKDGYGQEKVMADRLRLVHCVTLIGTDANGQQIGFSHIEGHFRGHCDGLIKGVLERPDTWHVWEHKSVNETKFNKLKKLREELGEKKALEKWDYTYYCQAQMYMFSTKMSRHYLTVSTPGGRDAISIRTEFDESAINLIMQKAHRIIYSTTVPAKISEKAEYYKCKMCVYSGLCHSNEAVQKSCGTCKYFEIVPNQFYCNCKNNEMDNMTPCEMWALNQIFANSQKIEIANPEKKIKTFAWSKN